MKKHEKCDYQNSKALFVMQIIAMSFAILAVVVFVTVTLFRWIADLNAKIKQSQTRIAKISARVNRLRRSRVKHILKMRKAQKKEEKRENRKKKTEAKAEQSKEQSEIIDESDPNYFDGLAF